MAEARDETFFELTLANLKGAWREVASSAARSVGLNEAEAASPRDAKALRALMAACLEARGGEVSARLRVAELGKAYLERDTVGRRLFLEILAREFAVDRTAVEDQILAYRSADTPEAGLAAEAALRAALLPPRVKLLTQFNVLPEGVKFLVDLRADLLRLGSDDPDLRGLEMDLRDLLESWFDVGFLDLRRITWDSPASLLEKLIAYEAVHEIRSWDDLRNRLDSDRRLFALFHPRMPEEPLTFVEVALVNGLAGNIQTLLDEGAPPAEPSAVDTAIFYSISNTQRGLRDISFGDYLIKRVAAQLARDLPQIKRFATLSPVPGFRVWLEGCAPEVIERVFALDELGGVRALGGSDDTATALRVVLSHSHWHGDPVITAALERPLTRLCARYFRVTRASGEPIDPVARFHLRNGARLERVHWLADTSPKGLRQSAGLMVNYCYRLGDIEKNHETYMQRGRIAMSAEVKALAKAAR